MQRARIWSSSQKWRHSAWAPISFQLHHIAVNDAARPLFRPPSIPPARVGVDRHARDVVKASNWSLEAYGLVSCSRPPAPRMQAWRGMPPAFCRCVSHCVVCPLAGFICHGIVLRQSTFWCHWQLLFIVTVSKTELRKISSAGSVLCACVAPVPHKIRL